MNAHPLARHLLVPAYLYSGWSLWESLRSSKQIGLFVAAAVICTLVTIVPAKLVEFRLCYRAVWRFVSETSWDSREGGVGVDVHAHHTVVDHMSSPEAGVVRYCIAQSDHVCQQRVWDRFALFGEVIPCIVAFCICNAHAAVHVHWCMLLWSLCSCR